jgi:hypothetical protein
MGSTARLHAQDCVLPARGAAGRQRRRCVVGAGAAAALRRARGLHEPDGCEARRRRRGEYTSLCAQHLATPLGKRGVLQRCLPTYETKTKLVRRAFHGQCLMTAAAHTDVASDGGVRGEIMGLIII